MFEQDVNKNFTVEDVLYDYSDLIEEIMLDGNFKKEEEVADLIRVVLKGVNYHRYDMIKFFISKIVEIQRRNATIHQKDIKGLIGADSEVIFDMLYDKYYNKISNEDVLMNNYNEEYSYGNNNDYYNDLDHMNRKNLKRVKK